ncbi:MAG: tail fiber protein [Terracidiphilus sp.]|jgi:microcystin-dependent protein
MSEPFIGQLSLVAFNFPPVGWAFAAGQIVPIAQYAPLFSLLQTTFGGDGRNNFGIPNMQNNVAVGVGQATPLSNYVLGQSGGAQNVTLSGNQVPPHTHAPMATGGREATSSNPSGTTFSDSVVGNIYVVPPPPPPAPTLTQMSQSITNSFGGGQQHNNMMPYQGLNWIIALQGIYPERPS